MVKDNWSYDDVLKTAEELENMLVNENDYIKRSYIAKVLDRTMRLYNGDVLSKYCPNDNLTSRMFDLNLDYYSYTRFYSVISTFFDIASPFEDRMSETQACLVLSGYTNREIIISNEECISLVHDFFMNTDSEFSKTFSELYNDSNSAIKFVKNDDLLNLLNLGGFTFFIDILRRNYISVEDSNDLYKAAFLAHECGHAVANLLEPRTLYYRQDSFLSELPSIFFELAFVDEIMKKRESFLAALFSFERHDQMITAASKIELHSTILEEFRNNNYKADRKLLKLYKDKYGFSKNVIYGMLNTTVDDDGTYVIGYMIALQLLNIYRQDKKEALKILRKMLSMYQEDSLVVLNTCVPKANAIKTEIDSIDSTMREELEKKNIEIIKKLKKQNLKRL